MTVRDIAVAFGFDVDRSSEAQAKSSIEGIKNLATKLLGSIAVVFSVQKLSSLASECVQAASNVQEMQNKFDVVFDGINEEVEEWAANFADSVGRNKNTIKTYLADQQNLLVGFGMTREEGAKLSEEMTTLALDLASFANLDETMAVNNMTKAVMGETESAKALGAVLNDVTRAETMAAMGMSGKYDKLSQLEKMQVNYNAILRQSPDAVGDCIRSMDSYEAAQRRQKAAVDELKESIGTQLIPIYTAWTNLQTNGIKIATRFAKAILGDTQENNRLLHAFERIHALVKRLQPAFERLSQSVNRGIQGASSGLNLIMPVVEGVTNLAVDGIIHAIDAIVAVADKLGGMQNLLKILASAAAALVIVMNWGKLVSGAKTFLSVLNGVVKMFNLANLKIFALMAVVALLLLAIEDFVNFMAGNDSLIGVMFERAGIDAEAMRQKIINIGNSLKAFFLGVWNGIKNAIAPIRDALAPILDAVKKKFQEVFGEDVFSSLGNGLAGIIETIEKITGKLAENKDLQDTIGKVVLAIGGLVLALGAIKKVTGLAKTVGGIKDSIAGLGASGATAKTGVESFGSGVLMAAAAIGILAIAAIQIAKAGPGAVAALAVMVAGLAGLMAIAGTVGPVLKESAAGFFAFGAALLMAAGAIALMSYSAVELSSAGPAAVAVLAGFAVGLAAFMGLAAALGPTLTASAAGLAVFGASIILAASGIALLANTAIQLASAGTPAIAVMAGLGVGLAALMGVAAVLGPLLTAGAVGLLAFGAAMIMVATAAVLGSTALQVIAQALPALVEYGTGGAVAILELGAAMTLFAAQAVLTGAGATAAGVGFGALALAAAAADLAFAPLALEMAAVSAAVAVIASSATVAASGLNAMKDTTSGMVVSMAKMAAAFATVTVAAPPYADAVTSAASATEQLAASAAGAIAKVTGLTAALTASALAVSAAGGSLALFHTLAVNAADVSGKLTAAFQAVESAAAPMASALADTVGPIIEAVGGMAALAASSTLTAAGMAGVVTGFASTAASILLMTAAISAINAGLLGTRTAFSEITATVTQNMQTMQGTVAGTLGTLVTTVNASMERVKTAFRSGWEAAVNSIQPDVIGGVGRVFLGLSVEVATAWASVQSSTVTTWSAVSATVLTALGKVQSGVLTNVSAIQNTVTAAVSATQSAAGAAMTAIQNLTAAGMNAVRGTVASSLAGIQANVNASISAMNAAVSGGMATARSTIVNGIQSIGAAMKSLTSQSTAWGTDIVNGIANGIRSGMGNLNAAVSATASSIRAQLHFSVPDEGPLTDFNSWMPDMMGQLASGIEKGTGKVTTAVKGLAGTMKSYLHFSVPDAGPLSDYEGWMPDFMAGLAKSLEDSGGVLAEAVQKIALQARERFVSVFDNIGELIAGKLSTAAAKLREGNAAIQQETGPAGNSLYAAMEVAGYPLDEMGKKLEALGVSSEAFHNALEASRGDADAFADALYRSSKAGTSFADVENALGFDLDTLGRIMAGAMGRMNSALDSVSAPDLTFPVSFAVQPTDFSESASDARRAADKFAQGTPKAEMTAPEVSVPTNRQTSSLGTALRDFSDALRPVADDAFQMGADFISRFRDGILSGVGALVETVKSVSEMIRDELGTSQRPEPETGRPESGKPNDRTGNGGRDAQSILDSIRELLDNASVFVQSTTAQPATAASSVVSSRTSTVTQNVNIDNTYNGTSTEGAKNVTKAMKKSASDATDYMARALAYS